MAIEDFGEKIGGARKDLYGLNRELRLDDIKEWSDIDRDKYITKKEVFPLPDYQRLYEGGMDREVLFFVKQVRDALPTRPFPHIRYNMTSEEKQEAVHQAQDDYIRTMGRFYETAIHLSSLTECADYLNNLKAENLPDKNCFSQKLYNVASIRDSYTLMQFRHQLEKKKFLYSDDEKALLDYDIFSYDGTNVEVTRDRKDEPILVIKQGGTRFYVYRNSPEILDLANWKENTYFVMDKSTHTIVTMNEPDRNSAEASAIALHKQKDVTVREQKKRKKKLIPPQLEKVRPTQEDYREGRNITGDDMMEIFGFRAGEFGNWENESDRQTNLNMSYDALKDLAKALNMSDQDVSLGGKLAIAYGARGVSGALAHFEPGTNVINLTKMRGAGSLAHEWGHALDYYIAQTTGKGEVFATDAWNGMSYMHDVMQTIKYKDGKRTEYYNNAVRLDERYSKAGQGYWQSDVELFARAFSSYIHDKLSGPSDYLVGHSEIKVPILVKDEQQWIYTSPQDEERKAINQAMDEMINAIKEHGLLHQGREKNVEAPKMTMDEYLGSQGVGFPTSGYVLDKVRFPNGISKRMHQQINNEFEKTEQEYADRRKEARREYQEKVDNGEIIPKTKEEINIERAKGDPNKESTQAARRLLVKRGIMTEEELSTNVKVWDKKWTKMTEANGNDIVQEPEILSDQELFTQQVDDVLSGVANQYNALKVCDTPQLLIEVGCKQLPMLITQKHLRDSLKPLSKSNSKWHGLTEQQIKKLPELIADPVMIYDSQTLKNSLVVVTSEIDSRNFPIIVSIKANGQGTYELQKIDSNFITSVYGRRNFAGHITDVVNKGDLLYWNKQKSQELFRVSRLQLPGCLNNLNFDIILHQSKSIVNTQLVEATVKQKKYAQQIAQALHVDLPQSNTKQAYQDFIKEHVEEYNQNRSVPVHYTDEQIARANAVDIVEYARSQGLELKRAGRDYRVSNYSGGFLITPEKNNWNWFVKNKGGGVVQLCMELENKTWQDAIGTLIQEDMVAIQRSDLQNKELDLNVDKYNSFIKQHRQLIQDKKVQYQNRTTVVINAFGGAGAGKTVACMDVCQQLKKRGYNAEYVSEYCKELVYENSDMLSGTPDNQFEILKEQMKRMDRMIGQVDFIVTDSPILLNSVYNKALTPEYEQMVQELFRDYDNFTFFVARDTSHYQTEGRIHTLAESMEKDKQIKQMLHDNDIYFGTYNHETIDKIVDNASKTFKRLQERDQQISKYVDQEVAVTREKDVQSLSIEEKILYLSVLDTVYEQDYWKMIEDDIRNLTESEKTTYKNEYNQKKDECRLDKALVPKVGIAVVLEDGTYALQDVKVVDERLAEMIKENPTQVDVQKMSVNGKMGDLLLLKDSILEPYELYKISEDGLIKMDVGTEDQRSVEQCRKNISEQMLSSSFDVSVEQRCVKPLLENGVTLSSEIQQHYQKITRYFESRKPAKENLAAPEKKKGITFQLK